MVKRSPKRLNVELSDPLHRQLKIAAAQRGTTIADLVRIAVAQQLTLAPGSGVDDDRAPGDET
jgi:hypothetical protein